MNKLVIFLIIALVLFLVVMTINLILPKESRFFFGEETYKKRTVSRKATLPLNYHRRRYPVRENYTYVGSEPEWQETFHYQQPVVENFTTQLSTADYDSIQDVMDMYPLAIDEHEFARDDPYHGWENSMQRMIKDNEIQEMIDKETHSHEGTIHPESPQIYTHQLSPYSASIGPLRKVGNDFRPPALAQAVGYKNLIDFNGENSPWGGSKSHLGKHALHTGSAIFDNV